ncbi:MAG: oligopeptide/dipeptide ABC transporter ATP-binding protein [Dermatophilaceae bacterium]
MYAGRAVEYGACREVLAKPTHPYTWGLLESIPSVSTGQEALRPIKGNPPSLVNLPPGCSFSPRCPYVERVGDNLCRTKLPELLRNQPDSTGLSRCHLIDPAGIFKVEVEPGLA